MAIFQVALTEGSTVTVHAACETLAKFKAEKDLNAPRWVGEKAAIRRLADNDGYFTRDGGYLIRVNKIRAVKATRMKEVVMCASYALVPA